jgi:hypothetical protein
MQCETVKIDDGKGSFVVINKDDFDKEKHKKYSEAKPKAPTKKAK